MDPLLRGEQAVLGAVLLDPPQLGYLDWLEPRDFYRPAHQAIFAAMRTLRAVGLPTLTAEGEVPLAWLTDTFTEAGKHVRGLTASYQHTLIAACPQPARAPIYGRMVLEGSIHRTVAEHATRLLSVADEGARQHTAEGTIAQADILAGVLADLARRWGTHPRPQAPPASPPAVIAPPPTPAQEDEQFLLALLVHQDGAIEGVFDWLRPGDFADPRHGQLYRCLGALHHRGEPIDPVTTLWEVQRRGLLAQGALTEEHLAFVLGSGVAGSAEWLGEQVLSGSVNRTASAAAQQIVAQTDDDRLAPGQLINQALHALGPVDDVRARWSRAVRQPTPESQPEPDHSTRVHAALTRSTAQATIRALPSLRSAMATEAAPHQGRGPATASPRNHP
ncbi:DnaB-like helicase N-terminal domain-containing protein [Kitasatospora sp. NPDC057015]|uniref:DnaB-like helicase N-terminal domain-containing protein n=1 Tax=Kitasatospora sp. NPDC057015 TaxID=3346001 RepID=UPI00362BBC9E